MLPEASPGHVLAELIRHKRDGGILSAREIGAVVVGIADPSAARAICWTVPSGISPPRPSSSQSHPRAPAS